MSGVSVDRRQVLAAGAGAALVASCALLRDDAMANPFDGEALHADVRRYVALATKEDGHRTGTPADLATLDWMEAHLREKGFAIERLEAPVPVFRPSAARLSLEGRTIEGFPQWPVVPTPAGLAAPLALVGDASQAQAAAGKIAVYRLPYNRGASMASPLYAQPIRALKAAGALAAVLITEGPTGEIVAINAPLENPPFGLPLLSVGPRAAAPILEAARAGRSATLQIAGSESPGIARSVIGRIARGEESIVISTPASGWFACGGERGPGIALWRALVDWTAEAGLRSSLVFVANSGHELGDLGAHQFLAKAAPPKDKVRLWFHLGAGIATYDWHEAAELRRMPSPDPQRYLLASKPVFEAAKRAFAGQPGLEQVYEATVQQAAGELRPILAAGYARAAGIFAGHRFHHVPTDDASRTGPELLRPVALALAQLVRATEKDFA